jgi:hypothetical protein
MANIKHALAHLHRVAIVQPARGHEGLGRRKTEHAALLGQAVDPELVALVGADDGQLVAARQLGRAAGVVDVRVRQPDLAQINPQALHRGLDARQIAARIDHCRFHRLPAPHDGAVLLEG